MNLEAPKNTNYAATIVELRPENLVRLENCDNIQGCLIYGNHVIVDRSIKGDEIGLFFPVETALSAEFLGQNNLYRPKAQTEAAHNVDPDAKAGFFENHGRVRAVKFRGHKSEGFWIPISSLDYISEEHPNAPEGLTFDRIGDHEICRKYVPKGQHSSVSRTQVRQAKLEDSIMPGQFRFHGDTENLRRNAHKIQPDDYISISVKFHGTSVVLSKILVKRNLRWYERALRKFGVPVQESEYGLTYSSRKVIKSVNGVSKKAVNHYYTSDIWGVVAKEVEDKIPNGFTLYGEIVGFTLDGSPIQKDYHYGCRAGIDPNDQPEGRSYGEHKFLVYRVTHTSPDGFVIELPWLQMKEFCAKYGLETVKELWYGKAIDFYPHPTEQHWNESLVKAIEIQYVDDHMCPYNNGEVPSEGVVVRVDHLEGSEAYKIKSFKFLEAESKLLDKGEADLETQQSETEEENVCEN